MYCRKCGKEIDYEAEYCKECQKTNAYYEKMAEGIELTDVVTYEAALKQEQEEELAAKGSRMEGFWIALSSVIVGCVAYILLIVSVSYLALEATAGTTLMLMTLGACIYSLVMGIRSVKCFNAQKEAGKVKPVATLVLGIVGIVIGAGMLFITGIFALMFMPLL